MASNGSLDEASTMLKGSTFHTPSVGASRSWLAEKESYGIEEENLEPFTDPLGIKIEPGQLPDNKCATNAASTAVSTETAVMGVKPSNSTNLGTSNTSRVTQKLVRKPSSSLMTTDNTSSESLVSDSSGSSTTHLPQVLAHTVEEFIQSLKEPRFAAPLEPSAVSMLYQEFYSFFTSKADNYLQTGGHLPHKKREIQMETYEEIAEKRRERSLRPVRLREYIEAAEARACSNVYERIFRPGVGDDVDRAKYIQHRVEIMKRIPVKLGNLDFDTAGSTFDGQTEEEREESMFDKLAPAGEEFALMDAEESTTPLSKLDHLINGHKLVVQALSEIFPSTTGKATKASADMILPALIYTLMSYNTPNLWLNLAFISRFRNASFMAGEPSYVLTNFQAAVGFLESATLESLGFPEDMESPADVDISALKTGMSSTERQPILEMILQHAPPSPQNSLPSTHRSYAKGLSPRVSLLSLNSSGQPTSSSRRASLMLHPNDIVTSADQAFKNIGMTFGNSYRFFLNKTNNSEKSSPGIAEGSASLLSDTNSDTQKKSISIISGDTASGTCSAIPGTPPQAKPESTFDSMPTDDITSTPSITQPEPSHHILGKFASLSMIKSLANPTSASVVSSTLNRADSPPTAAPSSPVSLPLIKKPLDNLCKKDWESLKLSEVKALHEDYRRLVEYLESIHAFEK